MPLQEPTPNHARQKMGGVEQILSSLASGHATPSEAYEHIAARWPYDAANLRTLDPSNLSSTECRDLLTALNKERGLAGNLYFAISTLLQSTANADIADLTTQSPEPWHHLVSEVRDHHPTAWDLAHKQLRGYPPDQTDFVALTSALNYLGTMQGAQMLEQQDPNWEHATSKARTVYYTTYWRMQETLERFIDLDPSLKAALEPFQQEGGYTNMNDVIAILKGAGINVPGKVLTVNWRKVLEKQPDLTAYDLSIEHGASLHRVIFGYAALLRAMGAQPNEVASRLLTTGNIRSMAKWTTAASSTVPFFSNNGGNNRIYEEGKVYPAYDFNDWQSAISGLIGKVTLDEHGTLSVPPNPTTGHTRGYCILQHPLNNRAQGSPDGTLADSVIKAAHQLEDACLARYGTFPQLVRTVNPTTQAVYTGEFLMANAVLLATKPDGPIRPL